MNTTEELLSNVAPIPDVKSRKRHSYIIIGKPGSGKTTLATKLAEITRSQLVNIDTSFQRIEKASEGPYQQIQQTLKQGGVISGESIYESLKSQLVDESLHTKGFVLEGLPMNIKSPTIFDQVENLVSIIQNFNCVLIDLRISDQDLLRRRAASWVDPVTNISYPGQQVLYSRQRRRDGWTDGEEDAVYIAERALNTPSAKPTQPAEDNDGDEETPEETPEIASIPPKLFKNQTSYPILSEKILDRLIKLPENDPERVSEELTGYKRVEERMEEVKRKYFNALQIVELDVTQHPEQVYDQMKARMDARGYSIYAPLYEVFKLTPPEQAISDILEADLIKYYLYSGMREGEPERELGVFQKNCPVSWTRENRLVEGKGELCAVYKGNIYFFASEEDLGLFTTYPDRYTSSPLNIPSCKVAFIGITLPFKNLVPRSVAEKYRLGYINPEETILEWEKSEWIVLKSDESDLQMVANQVFTLLKSGGSVSSDLYVSVIEYLVKTHTRDFEKLKKKSGWVLEGFPSSAEQVQLLAVKDLLPQKVFNILADYGETAIQSGFQKRTPIPTRRSSFVNHEELPFNEIMASEYSNGSVDTLKELSEKSVVIENINWISSQLAILTKVLEKLDIFVPQAVPLKSLGTIPIFGATKDYCPVSVKNGNKLVKGDPNFVAKFMGYIYYFSSEEAKSEFCMQPYYFVKNVKIPPPRIIVFGAPGSGKSSIISLLSKKWNLPIVNFLDFCTSATFSTPELNQEIKAAAQSSTAFSGEAIAQIFTKLYMDEPFATKGFILKGFPFSKSDLDLFLKLKMNPDAFLILQVDSGVAAKRKLPQAKKENEKAEQERLKKASSIVQKIDPANFVLQSLIKPDDKLLDELIVQIEQENNAISDYCTLLDAWGSLNSIKISTGRCFRPVMAEVEKELITFLKYRNALFLSTYTLDEKVAKNLLDYGVKSFSKLGKYCPVTIYNGGLVNPSNFGTIPVQCGDYLYYIKDKLESQFSLDPSLFISQKQPQPVLASNCCIVGNPKSGKSALAELLSRELDAIHLTVTTILQTILDGKEITVLCEKVRKTLQSGKHLGDQLIVDSIVTITNRIAASGKGWILDGFPATMDQALLLEKANFQPHYVFNISLSESDIISRMRQDLGAVAHDGLPALNGVDVHIARNTEWKRCLDFSKNLYQSKYSNWVDLDGLRSKWSLKQKVLSLSLKALHKRQLYLQLKTDGIVIPPTNTLEGKAAPASDVGLSNAFMLKHRSKFQEYCPFQLVESNTLNTETSGYYAEYQDFYYCLSSQEALDAFLQQPHKYISHNLPDILPKISSKSELVFPRKLQLHGYCPVTFEQGPAGIIPGSLDYIAEYNSELYAFATKEKLHTFMTTPWKFANLQLPKKLPPPIAPIPIRGLPISGYLEQALATSLTKSLVALGKARPKHPFKEIDQSACEFLGLYLKANNPSAKDWVRKSHNRKLKSYITNCELLKDLTQKISNSDISLNSELESTVNTFLRLAKVE